MTVARIAMIVLLAIACIQLAYFYPQISHAAAAAQSVPQQHGGVIILRGDAPDASSAQQTAIHFFTTYAAIIAICVALFFGVPFLFGLMPPKYIVLPTREYWFAPAQRPQTLALLHDRFNWLGAATLALVIIIMQLVLAADVKGDPRVNLIAVWVPLGIYGALAAWWIARLYAAFNRRT